MSDQMRAVLEAVRKDIGTFPEYGVSESTEKLIDEVLKPEPEPTPTNTLEAFEQTRQELTSIKHYLKLHDNGHVRNCLLNLPDEIQERSLKVAELTQQSEIQRGLIEQLKNKNLDLVLIATENGKPKFSNEQSRKVALEKLLHDDTEYQERLDILASEERQLKVEEIELEHSRNLFRAYLAIADMGAL